MSLPVYMPPPTDNLQTSRNLARSNSMLTRARQRCPWASCPIWALNIIWNVITLSWHAFVYFVLLLWSGVVYLALLITPIHYGDEDPTNARNDNFAGRSRGEYMAFIAGYAAASVAGTEMIVSFVSNEDNFKANHKHVIFAVGGIVAVVCFLTFYLILVYFTALYDPTLCTTIYILLNVFACLGVLAPGVSFIHWAVPGGAVWMCISYAFLLYLCGLAIRLMRKILKKA